MVLALVLAAAEVFWRARGHRPSVTDDKMLWALLRSRAYSHGSAKAIVLLGTSRMQLGVVPQVLEKRFQGHRALDLAIDGYGPFAALEDLAHDRAFDGVIICGAKATDMFPSDSQKPWTEFYHREWDNLAKAAKIIDTTSRVFLQSILVILNSDLHLRRQVIAKLSIVPSYMTMQPNRYRPGHYRARLTPEQIEHHRRSRIAKAVYWYRSTPDTREGEFAHACTTRVAPLVASVRSRGGNIVFLRMPSTDKSWEIEQRMYPKERYWDKIHELTGAETIHFRDVAALARFDCPDTSHLDAQDAGLFTERLADELVRRRIVVSRGVAVP